MNHYDWVRKLRAHYERALAAYQRGERDAEAIFDAAAQADLASVGLLPINVFDYVEDFAGHGEPDWDDFVLVASARRDYYLYEQHGGQPKPPCKEAALPAKHDAFEGIEWLPRIALKAQWFLEGCLPHDIMYGCGGDRRFLRTHDVHPADFLRMAWAARGEMPKLLRYLKR